jgi:catechol 2,3-dioxygenase-like lactoylglutathione lyase family enzyme
VKRIQLDHVSVTSADLDRSVAFYRDLLGLPLIGRGESSEPELGAILGEPGVRLLWAEVDLGGGQLLELLQYLSPDGDPLTPDPARPGGTHIGLRVSDIDAMYLRLSQAGVPIRSKPVEIQEKGDWLGVRCLYARDPDGVTIELVERPVVPGPVVVPDLEAARSDEG